MILIDISLLIAAMRAAIVHFIASLGVASLAACVVFLLWYPDAYREISGGRELFMLLVAVDVICGPILTLVLFNPSKRKRELWVDLSLVVVIQLSALAYGLYTVGAARPVWLAYEVDRLRVISAADIEPEHLQMAPEGFRKLSWLGPKLIGVQVAKPGDEDHLASLMKSIEGTETSFRPERWRSFESMKMQVLEKAHPLAALDGKSDSDKEVLDKAVKKTGLTASQLAWLPVQSRTTTSWIALIETQGVNVVGFAKIDGF